MEEMDCYERRGCGIELVDHVLHSVRRKQATYATCNSGVDYEENEDLLDILYWVMEDGFLIDQKKLIERILTFMDVEEDKKRNDVDNICV